MLEHILVEKEVSDAREKFEGRIRDMIREDETGIPAAVRRFSGADASLLTPKPLDQPGGGG